MLDKKTLGLAEAKSVAAAAEAEARENNWNVAIAVVDDGGHLIYLLRMDETQVASAVAATDKAKSAAQYKRPTKDFEAAVASGRMGILKLQGAMALDGGVPILSGGKIVGAIGVSGVTSAEDGQIARAGAATVK
jgi:uncharacterized protein GlcG (DUF336 family)